MRISQQQQTQNAILDQTGQLANSPLMDPAKNPDAAEAATQIASNAMNSLDE